MTDTQKNASYALAILFGVNLMNFVDRQLPGTLGEQIRTEFGMNDQAFGFVNTVFTLMYAAVGLPIGRLADTVSRTRIAAIGIGLWSLSTAASGAVWNYASLVVARTAVGIGEATCAPTSQSLIGDYYPAERRARAMGIFMLGLPIGLFLAYRFGGYIGTHYGWRQAFYIACVPGLLLAVAVYFLREPSRGAQDPAGKAVTTTLPLSQAMRRVVSIPTLWWIVLSGVLMNFNSYSANAFQNALLIRFHGMDLSSASNLSSLSLGLAGVIGLAIGGFGGDRLRVHVSNGRLLLAAVTMTLASPCAYYALEQPTGGAAMYGWFMAGFSAMTFVYYSTVYSAIQDVVEPQLRATAVAVYFFGQYVFGAAFGTTITGALSDHFAHVAMAAANATEVTAAHRAAGLHSAMYVVPVLALVCAVSLYGASATVKKDMARMQERLRSVG